MQRAVRSTVTSSAFDCDVIRSTSAMSNSGRFLRDLADRVAQSLRRTLGLLREFDVQADVVANPTIKRRNSTRETPPKRSGGDQNESGRSAIVGNVPSCKIHTLWVMVSQNWLQRNTTTLPAVDITAHTKIALPSLGRYRH